MDAEDYGYLPTYNFENINQIKEEIGIQTKYEVSLMSTINDSFVTIKENGNIEMFVDHMLGIKIDKNNNSIDITANDININGNTKITVPNKNGSIEISSDENNSYLSQTADYIGINSDISISVGNIRMLEGSVARITSDTVEIIANKFIVNGKEIT